MTQVTVKVKDQQVRTLLKNAMLAVRTLPKKVYRPVMEEARDEVRTYPAELPAQKYVRTGKRYTATKLEPVEMGYRIVSNPSYKYGRTGNPYVIGDARGQGQATIHKGRWALLADVIERALQRIVKLAEEQFSEQALLRGPGGL